MRYKRTINSKKSFTLKDYIYICAIDDVIKKNKTNMKKHLSFIILLLSFNAIYAQKTCDIEKIYFAQDVSYDNVKVITNFGSLEDAEIILTPSSLDEGQYKVELTRKAQNIYKIENQNYYLMTKYCYKYSNRKDVVLIINSRYFYNKGSIIFTE